MHSPRRFGRAQRRPSRRTASLVALITLIAAITQGAGTADGTVTPTGPVNATATGSPTPPTATEPATVTNGDFTITGLVPASTVGDGVDEQTTWTFDLSTDPDFTSLPPSGSLIAANLVLTVTPGTGGTSSDTVSFGALSPVNPTELAALPAGVTETVNIDLLHHYTEHQLLDTVAAGSGLVPMAYAEDATVTSAELTLLAAEEGEIFASAAAPSELFGFSIDVDATTAVVGAPGAAGAGLAGRAVVLTHDGSDWSEQAVLTAPTPTTGEAFGYDVAIDADTIVVGARNPGGSGAAYVFTGTGASWTLQAQLSSSPSGSADDQFGTSVDIDGDRLVVGAPLDDQAGLNSGAAHVFDRAAGTWTLAHSLGSQAPSSNGLFGDAVILAGGNTIVGAPIEAAGTYGLAGSAYVFDAAGAHLQTLAPSDRQSFHGYGTSFSFDNGTLVVGANSDNGPTGFDSTCTPGSGSCPPGSVYVYTEAPGGFTFHRELHASDLDLEANYSPGAQFGLEHDLVDGTLVVGARYNEGRTTSVGKAHVFRLEAGGWNPAYRLVASDSRQGDLLGQAVALGPAGVLAGAPNDDHANGLGSANEGALYVFTEPLVTPPTCGGLEPTIVGTSGDDVIVGTNGDDIIVGLGGNDVIEGGNGLDVICGGPGADQLFGGNGKDALLGESGDDYLSGGNAKDELDGGAGTDACDGDNGKDVELACE